MKKTILIFSLLYTFTDTHCQPKEKQFNKIMLSIGVDKTWINADELNAWSQLHYNKNSGQGITGHLDIILITKHFDFGISEIIPNPYRVESFYFGARLTHLQSRFSSFINLHVGELDALYNHLAPINYALTPDQQGKKMQLQFNNYYFGISSKNFYTYHFKKDGSGNIGFEMEFGYCPWAGEWNYGYYKSSGKYSSFVATRVYGIPQLGNCFVNTSVFYALGSR